MKKNSLVLAFISILSVHCGKNDPLPTPAKETLSTTSASGFWTSGQGGELTSELFVRSGTCNATSCDYGTRQIYKVNIGPVSVGDIFLVQSEAEYTNTYYNANQSRTWISIPSVIIGTTDINSKGGYEDLVNPHPQDFELTEVNGDNVSYDQHHHVAVHSNSFQVSADMASAWGTQDVYIILVAWAVSTRYAEMGSHNVEVGSDYGQLSITKF